jgi:hypothetical protein
MVHYPILQQLLTVHSVSQVHQCLLEWGLLQTQSSSRNSASSHTTHSDPDDWEIINHSSSPNASITSMTMNYSSTPPDPEIRDIYKKKPLPSLPDESRKGLSHFEHLHQPPCPEDRILRYKKKNYDRQRSSPDKLKLTCHHGHEGSHEVESTLSSFPEGSSPLELWISDEQNHEIFAVNSREFRARGMRGSRFHAAAAGLPRARQAQKPRRRKREGDEQKKRER